MSEESRISSVEAQVLDLRARIASLEKKNKALASLLRRFRGSFLASATPQFLVIREGTIVDANRAAEALVGWPRNMLLGKALALALGAVSGGELGCCLAQAREFEPFRCQLLLRRADEARLVRVEGSLLDLESHGTEGLMAVSVHPLDDDQPELSRLTRLTEDLRQRNEQLGELVHIDPLTNVRNRRGAEKALRTEVARARRSSRSPLAALIDCDDFKKINDRYGLAVGDSVLQELARRLLSCLRPSDHIARVGGDEFVVLLPDTSHGEGLRICERLRSVVAQQPFRTTRHRIPVTISLALVRLAEGERSLESVLRASHFALRRSKLSGKNRVTEEVPTTELAPVERLCSGEGLVASLQPIVDIPQQEVVGLELFSRNTGGTLTMPRDFFSVARERGLLVELDLQCLRTCIAAAREAAAREHDGTLTFHLNLFPATLLAESLEEVVQLLHGLTQEERVCLELSEQQLAGDPTGLREPLRRLKEIGVQVAIDDVGFRRGTLEALILLEPHVVKLGRQVLFSGRLRELEAGGGKRAMHRAFGRLSNVLDTLGIRTMAKGIENKEELDLLRELGIDVAQGFYFAFPSEQPSCLFGQSWSP